MDHLPGEPLQFNPPNQQFGSADGPRRAKHHQQSDYIDVDDVARVLGVCRATVYNLRKRKPESGKPPFPQGALFPVRNRRYLRNDFLDWAKAHSYVCIQSWSER